MNSFGRGRGTFLLNQYNGGVGRGSPYPSSAGVGRAVMDDQLMENANARMLQLDIDEKSQKRDHSESVASSAVAPSSFVTRPEHIKSKLGTSGREIVCYANFIPIESYPEWCMYQYHVSIEPVLDSKLYRTLVMKDKRFSGLFGDEPVFDGTILYTPKELPEKNFKLVGNHPHTGATIDICIKLTNTINIDDQQCLTIFNLCNRKAFESLGYNQMGRHYFNPKDGAMIQRHCLEIWPGVIASIRMYEEQLLMCCETSYKVLRTDTVYEVLEKLYRRYGVERFREEAMRTLVGTSVMTRYNNKTYRVDDILWNKRATDELVLGDGTRLTYKQYYETHYGMNIKDVDQPMLLSRSKKHGGLGSLATLPDIHLIPEFCTMTGLTEELRADREVMQELAQYTRVSPSVRADNARRYLINIKKNPNVEAIFKNWNLSMGSDILRLKGRVLPYEPLYFQESKVDYDSEKADWSRECRSRKINDAVPLDKWIMVFHGEEKRAATIIYDEIRHQCSRMSWRIAEPLVVTLNSKTTVEYMEGIAYGMKSCQDARIVVVVVPTNDKSRYDGIKKYCCDPAHAIPSQVVKSTSVLKNTPSVCSKILLQMNCKMGGSIWRVDIPDKLKKTMVIGYDCYYDSANKTKTVGACVSSFNADMTRWYSSSALHENTKEMSKNMTDFFKNAMEKYRTENNTFPDMIILYRDGVGEGQIPNVYKDELPQIRKCLTNIGAENSKLAFIIVTKRITLRFFEQKNNQFHNPPPGSLIDSAITRPERYDFYLVPQSVRQGTVTPVSYNVIYDDTQLKPDHMQRLAFKMCHMYFNWQGTIRVPAPCQYAHKLAFLVAQSLHQCASPKLSDKLYYL